MPDLSVRAERPTDLQRRAVPFRDVELRAKPDGSGGDALTFTGYACITEAGYEMSDWLGPFTEVVRQGAFTKTLAENADVPFLVNHDGLTLARTKSGTMRLAEDDTGLHTEADLDPASPHVQALRSAMDRGDVDEMSFAFWITRQQWSPDFDQRDILEVNLNKGDVSVVNYGANPNTAGAQLNSREVATQLQRLTADERRDVFDRLAAEFTPVQPLEAVATMPTLGLLEARARALAL
jgi:HK97 family phage prohead protease